MPNTSSPIQLISPEKYFLFWDFHKVSEENTDG